MRTNRGRKGHGICVLVNRNKEAPHSGNLVGRFTSMDAASASHVKGRDLGSLKGNRTVIESLTKRGEYKNNIRLPVSAPE